MRKKWMALVLVMTLLLILGNANQYWAEETEEATPTKITKIVLYKHGMGYFEREGVVNGDSTINLGFKTNQMKDVLTSLFAIDLNGGEISTVSYDSKDPISKQLENILIRVPENAALTQFLKQLKGAKIEVKIGNEIARGNILGIEPVYQKIDNTVITAYKFILLKENGEIQPFNLLEVTSLKLLDDPIQKDLKRVLDIYLNSKYTDLKQVKLNCVGKGERNILMGYLIEMPIWKTSYRLILDDKAKPYLQGWAIVENTTDEDWKDVEMSFVAGNPISFSMDLYTSYYPQRPNISLSSIIPMSGGGLLNMDKLAEYDIDPSADGYISGNLSREKGDYKNYGRAKKSKESLRKHQAPAPTGKISNAQRGRLLQQSISSLASGIQIGELFSYNSRTPVSINRRKAAMVPIITESIEGSKILYYRANVSPRLMNAFYLNNSTLLTLETGPVTFFEGSTSVGEGLLKKSLQTGMKEVIPYAIETGCTINITSKHKSKPVHKCKIANGVLVTTNYGINSTTYKLANKTTRDQVVYFDHPRTSGYKLIQPKKADEEIPGYYRFKLDLKAGKDTEFTVQEQREISSTIYLQNISMNQIKFYLSQSPMSKQAKEFLAELGELMEKIADQKRIYNESKTEYNRLSQDQGRYRENMRVLNTHNPKERDLRDKYVEKLDKVEDQMAELKGTMLEAQDKQNQLQKELLKKIRGFNEQE